MNEHKYQVSQTARVISYFIKDSDHDQMALYFASRVFHPVYCPNSTAVETAIHNHKFANGRCDMRATLTSIAEPIIATFGQPNGKTVSIYILTDAMWMPGDPGVDRVIERVAKQLKAKNLPREYIMFQFIRFGDSSNQLGKGRLRYLDDDITDALGLGDYDLVDTRHCDDHVPSILVGSISKFYDNAGGAALLEPT